MPDVLLPSAGDDIGPPIWRMVYHGLAGVPIGEVLNAHDRNFQFSLFSPSNISFTLDLVSPQTRDLLIGKEGFILLYRNNTLAMTAELSSIQVTGDESNHSLAVVATETMYPRLQHRMLGQSKKGLNGPTSPTDQGTWMSDRLDDLNTIDDTGLRFGTVSPSGNISGGNWRFKPYMELMQELAATTAGFDFYQRPADPNGTGITGYIDVAPILGSVQSNVVFEYGAGAANASSYEWIIHNESIVNRAIALPPSYPDSAGLKVAVASDATSISNRGRREESIPTDLNDYSLRQQLAQLHVNLRKLPREQFIIQPAPTDGSPRVPGFLDDYNVGDYIRGRVLDQNILMLDGFVRVYGVEVQLTDEGQEQVNLTLIAEEPSS